ncbi:MAG: hypothetical protein HC836_22645 [Richelia sp. RM2_1_2]|nr:hypothetical protein [Richelia sp. RM2_1_2]
MKWPFKLTLSNLILKGKTKELARAQHELKGEELDKKLLDLEHDDKSTVDYMLKVLELDKKYNAITEFEYEKQKATLKNEPWVGYRDYGLEKTDDKTGFWFEFDWNSAFVDQLKREGYDGVSDEQIVQRWYAELCRTVAIEEGLALDLFSSEEEKQPNVRKIRKDDGMVEYH